MALSLHSLIRGISLLPLSLVLLATPGLGASSQNYQALSLRQNIITCSGGGTCDLGNVCCGDGCMFSSGNCCGGAYFCYVGESCSGPNNVGDVDCCISGSCTPAKFVIDYSNFEAGAGGAAASSSTTAIASSAIPTSTPSSTPESSTTESSTATSAATESSQVPSATSGSTSPTTTTSTASGGATSKAAAAGPVALFIRLDFPVLIVVLIGLGMVLV